MEPRKRERGHDKGLTGNAIGGHVRAQREYLGIDLAELASRLVDLGWPITKSALSRLENGQRRVDVDDLMALSIALNGTPLGLLLGAEDGPVAATCVPSWFIRDEVWAWASGEVELDRGELVLWWQAQLDSARMHLEGLEGLYKSGTSHLSGQATSSTRRMLEREIAKKRHECLQAIERINELTGDGEVVGMTFAELPADPTAHMITPNGDDDG